MIGWLGAVSGWLPAIFWVFYTLWNTVLTEPPALGRLTAINALYLLMLPATLLMAVRWRETRMAGQGAYLAFLAWLVLGIAWHNPSPSADVVKALFICALALPVAAQMLPGGRRAAIVFAGSVILTAVAISVWMVWQALASGFQYRTGTLLNQNFVATMVAPGLLIAIAGYLDLDDGRLRRALLAVVLLCSYASLLLGSRGVLIAQLVAVGALVALVRPSLRQTRGLLVGTAVVVVLAQLPMIPNALWQGGWRVVTTLQASVLRVSQPAASTPATTQTATAGNAGGSGARPATKVPPASIVDRPLDPRAAQSTALSRFVERDTGTLDKRTGVWRGTVKYIVSSPAVLLAGGGLGISGSVAYEADPVFRNAHNTYLQLLADTGLVGVGLLAWLFWGLLRRLAAIASALSLAWLALLVFWLVAGLTATVIDLHVCWVTVGAAMAATAGGRGRDRQAVAGGVAS